MPTYEYQCTQCQHQFNILQKISDAKLTQCPECQQNSLQRLISAAGFQLKGSGWYVTDFKNKDTAKTDTSSTDTAKTETPPGATTETKSEHQG